MQLLFEMHLNNHLLASIVWVGNFVLQHFQLVRDAVYWLLFPR